MSLTEFNTVTAQVAIAGGGIAGAWAAYRLAQRGIATVLVRADEAIPPLSRIWAPGVIRQTVVDGSAPPSQVFVDRSTTQTPGYQGMMAEHAVREFNEYSRLVDYYKVDERFLHPVIPERGIQLSVADAAVGTVLEYFEKAGGRIVEGRVTDLLMSGDLCLGLAIEHDGRPAEIHATEVVLAGGGFCGLFPDGVGYNPGCLLGTYARSGGTLANLELFNRFTLGDLDRRRPLYPFDLEGGVQLLRDGAPATELRDAMAQFPGDQCDIEVFARYWTRNLDTPHTVELTEGTFRLWPVRGFAMGGAAPGVRTDTAPRNIHAVGECAYGMSLDSVTGKPFVSFLAAGAELAWKLAGKLPTGWTPDGAAPNMSGQERTVLPPDKKLREEVSRRLFSFQDTRFSVAAAEEFLAWCLEQRRTRSKQQPGDRESRDLLILAEAFTRSVLARTESRGFFFRPDFPETDHGFDGRITVARYDAELDQVDVTWAPVDEGSAL